MDVTDGIVENKNGLTLDNTSIAFKHLSTPALRKENYLFRIFLHPFLVKAGSKLALRTVKIPFIKTIIKNTIFSQFCGGETIDEVLVAIDKMDKMKVKTVLDYAAEGVADEAGFDGVKNEVIRNIKLAGAENHISFISLKITGIADKRILMKLHYGEGLDANEAQSYQKTWQRLNEICEMAQQNKVVIYIDAEESWIQKPIDEMALSMMEKYNKKKAVVFNTFQMYLKKGIPSIMEFINDAISEDFYAGIKIVRGAYLEKEREEAARHGLPSPVFDTKEETDKNFDDAISLALSYMDVVDFCLATHNEKSTMRLVEMMQKQKINKDSHKIYFSQLYGMSDNITYNLADAGYNVSKYLPYGHVETAIPYLIRRAEENGAISGQINRELVYTAHELNRRKAQNLLMQS